MGWFSREIGIDLGTANTLVYRDGQILLNEPSVVAVQGNRVLAVGNEAKEMIGRTPGDIKAIQPLKDGVIADFDITQKMLSYFIRQVIRKGFFRPVIVVGIPSGATSVERRAVEEAGIKAGAREVYLIEEPMAAAIGANIPINEPAGHMVVDIGGGTTEIAVTSLGGIVTGTSIRVGGNALDQAITLYVRRSYSVVIGERTAEEIKMTIGSAYLEETEEDPEMEIKGRNLVTGLPINLTIHSSEINKAITEPISEIIRAVKSTLEATPPELSSDIFRHGVVLTGGGALLKGLDRLLREETGLPIHVAENPLACVAIGTGKYLRHLEKRKAGVRHSVAATRL